MVVAMTRRASSLEQIDPQSASGRGKRQPDRDKCHQQPSSPLPFDPLKPLAATYRRTTERVMVTSRSASRNAPASSSIRSSCSENACAALANIGLPPAMKVVDWSPSLPDFEIAGGNDGAV